MSSDTQPRLLDEGELDIVSGGQPPQPLHFNLLDTQYTLVGDQLTTTVGGTSRTRTLTPTQAADLRATYQGVQAGVATTLATANAILSDLRSLFF